MSSRDDAEEFAAMLRRLKTGSDRSYAALARHLNMNASTLHRYCSGEAVPLEFAPVERFAALCGADPAERVELHRLWILAVAARQRARATGAESGQATGEARTPAAGREMTDAAEAGRNTTSAAEAGRNTTDAVEAGRDTTGAAEAGRHATRAQETGPEATRPPGAGPDAARVPGHGIRADGAEALLPADGIGANAAEARLPADGIGADGADGLLSADGLGVDGALAPPSGRHPAEVLPPVTDFGTGSSDRTGEGSPGASPVPSAAPRKRRFRRRAAVTAAVVTAIVATLGSLSALPSGHSGKDAADRVVGAPTGKATGERRGSATPSASPSATHGRPSGSPSPSPSGSRDTSPSPSASPSPTGVSAGPPFTWTVNSHRWAVGCGHTYVIDKTPDQVPPPPAPQDASPWAQTQNAVHGGETIVDFTVQGRSDAAVVLEALRVRVVGRSAPLKGIAYATGGGCGGSMGVGSFTVDLDKDRPVARPVASDDDGTGSRILAPPFRVSVRDPQMLMVDALTTGCDCRWYLELDWSSRGRTGTVRIDDQGVPFRTSGIKGLPYYWYRQNGWALTSAD
ncbi:helix-turn-helix domain-containing protein [Streptomyces sp. NPDC059445]|uniref:helix-turn-helix domain-containing protein n=1 Tax=Streptomyces sp. NPDC059445 TaxID=3346832 RepID=UPI00369721F5